MRFLAIDLGDKRTGLAVGDSVTRIATPVKVVEVAIDERAGEALLAALAREVDAMLGEIPAPGELVMGLPLNMDETEGPRAKLVRVFAQRVANTTRRVVHLQDERETTDDAIAAMAGSGLTHGKKKARRDAIAAMLILRAFLGGDGSCGQLEPGVGQGV
jgi:putative holliday junction resolvase